MKWLHTGWPAGTVEKLPVVQPDGSTNVSGIYVVGDLTGVPLLKFSSDTGARAVQSIVHDAAFRASRDGGADVGDAAVLDLVIIGAGVSGMAAALEARKHDLRFEILEAAELFSTIVNFPKRKPIYTYPTDMTPAGDLQFAATVKEDLVDELYAQTQKAEIQPRFARCERVLRRGKLLEVVLPDSEENLVARRVIVAIGRSGNFRKLGVPGEDKDKIYNRLHDPKDFCGQNVLVVGGGDSALETAIALAQCGSHVVLSYRKADFSRPKPENIEKVAALVLDPAADVQVEQPTSERVTTSTGRFLGEHRKPGSIDMKLPSEVERIDDETVTLATADEKGEKHSEKLPNDAVFTMIGREAPLEFFRRSGIAIHGEWSRSSKITFGLFLLFCTALYDWKSGGYLDRLGQELGGFPYDLGTWISGLDPQSWLGITVKSAQGPSFWYTLAYSALVVIFGLKRIRRRSTPYVKVQTYTLMAIQVVPLFLLPEIILPWLNYHGAFPEWIANPLFPEVDYGHGREFWRAYGLVLAWPLMVYNIFTDAPVWGWVILGSLQTLVFIPGLIYFFGKGAYCGWICSCGALAETLGDTHRQKMPHGPRWNRLNMIGQGILALAVVMLLLRIAGWALPDQGWLRAINLAAKDGTGLPGPLHLLSYKWTVDVFLAGVLGYGLYFWYSGRMWCRFACPLAALMHIYARFSRFRILADKKKCISCNVCTSVCHQGIDVMNFANKGMPMEDPECVRCSACVQSCPTGTLTFGQIDRRTGAVLSTDTLPASPVQMAEQERAS